MLELWSLVTSSRLLLFKDILKKSTNIHIIRVCKSIDKVLSVPVPMNFEKILSFSFFNSYSKFTSLLSAVKMALFNIKSTKSHILLAIILAVQAANSKRCFGLLLYLRSESKRRDKNQYPAVSILQGLLWGTGP